MKKYGKKQVLINKSIQLVAVSHGYQPEFPVGCCLLRLPTKKYSWQPVAMARHTFFAKKRRISFLPQEKSSTELILEVEYFISLQLSLFWSPTEGTHKIFTHGHCDLQTAPAQGMIQGNQHNYWSLKKLVQRDGIFGMWKLLELECPPSSCGISEMKTR